LSEGPNVVIPRNCVVNGNMGGSGEGKFGWITFWGLNPEILHHILLYFGSKI